MRPPAARSLAAAVSRSLAAAQAADDDALDATVVVLLAQDPGQVAVLLGGMVRSLLEQTHPAGLSGDDAEDELVRCLDRGAGWFSALDTGTLVLVLAGALGTYDPAAGSDDREHGDDQNRDDQNGDEEPPGAAPSPPVSARNLLRHAMLVLADLLALAGSGVDGVLDAALAEIARAETVEMP